MTSAPVFRRGHGFDSRSGLNFFQALFLNCLSWVYTAMIFICLKCIFRSTNIWHVFLSHSQLYYQKNQHYCEVSSVTGNFAKGEGDSVVISPCMVWKVWFFISLDVRIHKYFNNLCLKLGKIWNHLTNCE